MWGKKKKRMKLDEEAATAAANYYYGILLRDTGVCVFTAIPISLNSSDLPNFIQRGIDYLLLWIFLERVGMQCYMDTASWSYFSQLAALLGENIEICVVQFNGIIDDKKYRRCRDIVVKSSNFIGISHKQRL